VPVAFGLGVQEQAERRSQARFAGGRERSAATGGVDLGDEPGLPGLGEQRARLLEAVPRGPRERAS